MNKNAITLKQFSQDFSKEDRQIIDAEKKYYQIVVALKKERQQLGLTQEKLAKLSKLPRTTITKIESGARNTTIQTLMSMANAMGKTIELKIS